MTIKDYYLHGNDINSHHEMKIHNKKASFITLEGIDGSGKSTVLPFVEKKLREKAIDLVVTREPGGTEIAEKIRQILLFHDTEKVHPDTELLLYFAARAQHFAEVIKPALDQARWVLSDRFTDATYAYQGAGRGMDMQKIATLENLVQGDIRPDLVLILDIAPEIGLMRLAKDRSKDRFEIEDLDFFRRVRKFYLNRAKRDPWRYKVIDASKSLEEVIVSLNQTLDLYRA